MQKILLLACLLALHSLVQAQPSCTNNPSNIQTGTTPITKEL